MKTEKNTLLNKPSMNYKINQSKKKKAVRIKKWIKKDTRKNIMKETDITISINKNKKLMKREVTKSKTKKKNLNIKIIRRSLINTKIKREKNLRRKVTSKMIQMPKRISKNRIKNIPTSIVRKKTMNEVEISQGKQRERKKVKEISQLLRTKLRKRK